MTPQLEHLENEILTSDSRKQVHSFKEGDKHKDAHQHQINSKIKSS